jgi:hypothetical protein
VVAFATVKVGLGRVGVFEGTFRRRPAGSYALARDFQRVPRHADLLVGGASAGF